MKNKSNKKTLNSNKICKLLSEKLSNFGLTNAKKVRIHEKILTKVNTITDWKSFNIFSI